MAKRAKFDVIETFLERPTRETLDALVNSGVGETNTLEFKEDWIKYADLARHVLAIGNSGGGVIVFGVHEEEDGSFTPAGLDKLTDPAKVAQGIGKFLPPGVEYELVAFPPRDPDGEGSASKHFQVMFIDSEARNLPLIARSAGDGLRADAVYVRRGTSSVVANHGELERLINRRIESGYSSRSVLELEEHLEQLKTLYKSIPRTYGSSSLFAGIQKQLQETMNAYVPSEPNPLYPEESFDEFLSELIPRKKRKIERFLELDE